MADFIKIIIEYDIRKCFPNKLLYKYKTFKLFNQNILYITIYKLFYFLFFTILKDKLYIKNKQRIVTFVLKYSVITYPLLKGLTLA